MNMTDEQFEREPPSDDLLAAEYVVGVLDADARRAAQSRIDAEPAFAGLVAAWEQRFAGLLAQIDPVTVPAHVWLRLRTRLGWSPVEGARRGMWQDVNFWRAATAVAAAAAIAVVVIGRVPQAPAPAPTPPQVVVQPKPAPAAEEAAAKPVTMLAREDGTPGWLASVDVARGSVLMVPIPAPADAQGRVPELWLIPAGEAPVSLGLVSIDKSHTVSVPAAIRRALAVGSTLAITLEPQGGAPKGIPTGPVIVKGDIRTI
jgi:anti-sigma-K factor RskA